MRTTYKPRYIFPNRNAHAALAFAYFQACAALDDETADEICSELFDRWGNAWEELRLYADEPAES